MFCCFNGLTMHLLCADVLADFFLISLKWSEHTAWLVSNSGDGAISGFVVALKCSNIMPSIDTDRFTPYYSD